MVAEDEGCALEITVLVAAIGSCGRLHAIEVDQSVDAVRVTALHGDPPEAGGACQLAGRPETVRIPLEYAVGGATLVDAFREEQRLRSGGGR